MHIEIITTPNEALKESGFGSIKACKSVLDAIRRMGFNASLSICKTKNDLDDIIKRNPDLVILAVKYIPAINNDKTCVDDIWLSDYFAHHGVNFTGSSRQTLKFDSNKVLAKTHLKNKGIKTANYFLAVPGQHRTESDLPITFPLFLKPLDAANGNGIDDLSYVTNFTGYRWLRVTCTDDSFSCSLGLSQPASLSLSICQILARRQFTVCKKPLPINLYI